MKREQGVRNIFACPKIYFRPQSFEYSDAFLTNQSMTDTFQNFQHQKLCFKRRVLLTPEAAVLHQPHKTHLFLALRKETRLSNCRQWSQHNSLLSLTTSPLPLETVIFPLSVALSPAVCTWTDTIALISGWNRSSRPSPWLTFRLREFSSGNYAIKLVKKSDCFVAARRSSGRKKTHRYSVSRCTHPDDGGADVLALQDARFVLAAGREARRVVVDVLHLDDDEPPGAATRLAAAAAPVVRRRDVQLVHHLSANCVQFKTNWGGVGRRTELHEDATFGLSASDMARPVLETEFEVQTRWHFAHFSNNQHLSPQGNLLIYCRSRKDHMIR